LVEFSFIKARIGSDAMQKIHSSILVILLCFYWLASCRPAAEDNVNQQTPSGWETAQPDEVGIDGEILVDLVSWISSEEYPNIHSVLIVKDGKLVFERYFPGYAWDWDADQFQGEFTEFDSETLHSIMSVSKVFTSTLAGIAVEQGFISDLDQPVLSYFPEYSSLSDRQKNDITLEHLLTMSSGLQWNSIEIPISTRDPRSDVYQMHLSVDPVAYVLAKPLTAEPGSQWYYSNGDVTLLGEVIRAASDLSLDQFAEQYLFTPLGITDYRWRTIGDTDVIAAGGGLELRPRDMAKLGLLYLNGGVWNGEQIISAEWVGESVSDQATVQFDWLAEFLGEGYGYYWWLPSLQTEAGEYATYTSTGWGGQRIYIFPGLDMVVVITGGNYVSEDPAREIIEEYILPSVEQAP
jgi:CubicO group peptidase (beta-lactamase class C family)